MAIKRLRFLTWLALFLGAMPLRPCFSAAATATQTLYLSGTDKDHTVPWKFLCTAGRKSGVWSSIPVPSNWETKGFGTYTHGFTAAPTERGLYKTSFVAPSSWKDKSVSLVFEGAMTDTQVNVNGISAGPIHQGGFYRFRYDVTPLLQYDQPNLLEVMVSKDSSDASVNRAERQGDYWCFGGIYRPVYLEAKPKQHLGDVAINAKADGTISVDAQLEGVGGADALVAQVQTLEGKKVGNSFRQSFTPGSTSASLTGRVPDPLLWNAETPHLYNLNVTLLQGRRELHRIDRKFGFRTVEVRAGDGIYINGRKIILKGATRHDFWPDSGRTMSPAISRSDVLLMKEMNMNAVLTAHYPPDQSFLDTCDELGLYVLDELAGWQKKYDTGIGGTLLKEMVERDVNHPSIILWCNGNEYGWNADLDNHFELFDPQKRKVIHPTSVFDGIKTNHYENYEAARQSVSGEKGNNIYLPTEFQHGLYDGGAGAGLEDFWNMLTSHPLGAGGFIWTLLDEGLVRDDQGGAVDVAGNNYPDGILGPYRQKEGSFDTIRDIWSPIQLADAKGLESNFPTGFQGSVGIRNLYDFTNAKQCSFNWKLLRFSSPEASSARSTFLKTGEAASPDIRPGEQGSVMLSLPGNWLDADALCLSVTDPSGRQISSWTWTIKKAIDFKNRLVNLAVTGSHPTNSHEDAGSITLTANGTEVTLSKTTGRLTAVKKDGVTCSLSNGPVLATGTATMTGIALRQEDGSQIVAASYDGNLKEVQWRLYPSGWLELHYEYNATGPQDYAGVNFDYPEAKVKAIKWLGQGPYRVWKNRMRGEATNVWSKAYNDTTTGAGNWNYPEFKGYYAKTYWAQLTTTEGKITLAAQDEDLFLRLFTPRNAPDPKLATAPFPSGDISLLDAIPPIGDKFHKPSDTGPAGAPNTGKGTYERTVSFFFGNIPTLKKN